MLLLKLILYPTIVLLGALAVFGYRNVKKIIKKYRGYQDCQVDPEWEGFIRKDFNRWDEKKIIIGSIFRFPFKLLTLMVTVLIFAALLIFSIKFKRVGQKLQALYTKYVATFALSCIIDIFEYGRVSEIKSPLIISNHVNWMDIIYLMIILHPLGYVCK